MNDNTPKRPNDNEELNSVKSAGADNINTNGEDSGLKVPPSRKKIKIFLVILIILALVIGGLCIRYWHIVKMVINKENIEAYLNSRKYSTEEIQIQMDENKSKMEKIAEESPLIEIRGELTEEEVEAMKNGEITQEEAASIVKGDITLEELRAKKAAEKASENEEEEEPEEEPQDTDKTPEADAKEPDKPQTKPSEEKKPPATKEPEKPKDRVSEIVSQLYVIQADFLARLEGLGDSAYADYKATHYDRSQVMTIVDSYTATVGAMEAECDGKVNALIKELRAELQKTGQDMSMAKEIQNYYYTEKSLKKSYYLNKLNAEDYN